MESHPECGMCYSSFDMVKEQTGVFTYDLFRSRPEDCPMWFSSPEEFIVKLAYVAPPSWLIRKELYFSIPGPDQIERIDSTFIYFTHFLVKSQVYAFSNDISRRYIYKRSLLDTQFRLVEFYHLDRSILPQCRKSFYKWLIKQAIDGNDLSVINQVRKGEAKKDKIESFIIADFSHLHLIQCGYRISRTMARIRKNYTRYFCPHTKSGK